MNDSVQVMDGENGSLTCMVSVQGVKNFKQVEFRCGQFAQGS
jgi:hypothetical protein